MTHYETLGVSRTASADEIKAAFRQKARAHHPDREGGDPEEMTRINVAYAVLSDPERRQRYDETGDDSETPSLQQEARHTFLQMINEALAADGNVVDCVRRQLDRGELQGRMLLRKTQEEIQRLQKRRDKISVKTGNNLFHEVIDGKIRQGKATIAHLDNELLIAGEIRKLIEVYESSEGQEAEYTIPLSTRFNPIFYGDGRL